MDVQPTLIIDPGYKFKIIVMKDMVLEPIEDAQEHSRTQNKLKQDLGPLVLSALSDEGIYEIMLNPDGVLWVDGFQGNVNMG